MTDPTDPDAGETPAYPECNRPEHDDGYHTPACYGIDIPGHDEPEPEIRTPVCSDPYHQPMAQPPLAVAVVGDHEQASDATRTAAWVAGRDIAQAGAWLLVSLGGPVAASAMLGAAEHGGVVIAFADASQYLIVAEEVSASFIVRTGLGPPVRAVVLAANADAMLAFPGGPQTMAEVAAGAEPLSGETRMPIAQVDTDLWPGVHSLTPTEVPAWLAQCTRARAAIPPAPDLTTTPTPTDTPASELSAPSTS
jgi:hypothetical protein